jgi:hypothetical protein
MRLGCSGFEIKKIGNMYCVLGSEDNFLGFDGIIRMNESGKIIFEKIMQGYDEKEIISQLSDEYPLQRDEIKNMIRDFFDYLRKNGVGV